MKNQDEFRREQFQRLESLLDEKPKGRSSFKLAKRPARKWRNRWYSPHRLTNPTGTRAFGPGEFVGKETYPSHEVAEQAAIDVMRRHQKLIWRYQIQYRGPVGAAE